MPGASRATFLNHVFQHLAPVLILITLYLGPCVAVKYGLTYIPHVKLSTVRTTFMTSHAIHIILWTFGLAILRQFSVRVTFSIALKRRRKGPARPVACGKTLELPGPAAMLTVSYSSNRSGEKKTGELKPTDSS